MQLVAYGAQDIYLTGNPQITFFKVVYRRHTNFSMEAIEQTMNGTISANATTSVTISRNGDLVGRVYVESITPATQVLNGPADEINNVEVEIGGQMIDRHYGHWLETYAELVEVKVNCGRGLPFQQMSGIGSSVISRTALAATDGATGTGGAAVAHDMDGNYVFLPLQFWFCRNPGLALPLIALQYHEVKLKFTWAGTVHNSGQKVYVDYIYLDTDERRRFAQVSHEYLIEQVQFQSETSSTSFTLNFNHPVKELIWTGGYGSNQLTAFDSCADGDTFQLKLNGHDRFAAREVKYFTRCQVWQHHTGNGGLVEDSLAVYSFALKPEEHQPSGTCNFSRIDNAELKASRATPLNIYAVNYNVLRIMSGMGGLAYSN